MVAAGSDLDSGFWKSSSVKFYFKSQIRRWGRRATKLRRQAATEKLEADLEVMKEDISGFRKRQQTARIFVHR